MVAGVVGSDVVGRGWEICSLGVESIFDRSEYSNLDSGAEGAWGRWQPLNRRGRWNLQYQHEKL